MRDTATRVGLLKERIAQKRHKQERRAFCSHVVATLLSLALVAGLAPTIALATGTGAGKAMQLGTDAIKKGDTVYYGTCANEMNGYAAGEAIQWQVLDAQKDNTGDNGMFLLSKYLLEEVLFEANWDRDDGDGQVNPNDWRDSDAQAWCRDFVQNSFVDEERGKIKMVSKTDSAETLNDDDWGESKLNNDQAFFLSAREVCDYISPVEGANERRATYKSGDLDDWWLRSPQYKHSFYAGYVSSEYCFLSTTSVEFTGYAARPAINLNLDSVLFVSAANGGKADAAVDGNLTAVRAAGNEWKLTLRDASRTFTASTETTTIETGQSLSVGYSDSSAERNDNEYVSVMIAQGNTILYYGRVAQFNGIGTASVAIPSDLAPGSYTLKVFSEQCNGDGKTDYASDFVNIPLTVTQNTTTHTVTVETEGGGAASADPPAAAQGQEVTLTASPAEDSHFAEWQVTSGTATIAGNKFTMPASDVTVKAVFEAHSYDQQVASDDYLASPATCTDPAKYYYSCTCGAKGAETFESGQATDSNNHSPASQWTQENNKHYHACLNGCGTHLDEADCSGGTATCTAKAVCITCENEYGALAEHTLSEHPYKAPTCTKEGNERYWECSACGALFSDTQGTVPTTKEAATIEQTGHDWSAPVWQWANDGKTATVTFTCQHDSMHVQSPDVTVTNKEKTPATCTEAGVFTYTAKTTLNSQEFTSRNDVQVSPLGHTMRKTDRTNATCTAPGKEAYYTCEACGKRFEDEAGETEIANLAEFGVIPMTGHTAGTKWTHDDASHWNECTTCGAKLNEAAHDFEWMTDKEATATEAGSKHKKCAVCGYAKDAVEIPATGTATGPTKPDEPNGGANPTDTATPGNASNPTDGAKPDDTTNPADAMKSDVAADKAIPQTGDNNAVAIWAAAAIALAAAAAVVVAVAGTALHHRKSTRNR